jgi:lipopolysaccharide/colanic/teichoic acid biosynthesis glycosyltransferase
VWGYLVSRDCAMPATEAASLGDSTLRDRNPEANSAANSPVGSVAESAAHEPTVHDQVSAAVPDRRRPARWESPAGRLVDVTLAVVALILLALPMLVVAITIRLASPGPALFRQRRIGLGGRAFTMYKFRTMQVGCSDEVHRDLIARELRGEDTSADGSWKISEDSRLVPFGDLLRRTSIDELPQLFNVVRGQMALVGPRPCLDWEAEMFPPEYSDRFAVRPGITGLWQVNGRSTMGTLEMLQLDVAYARGWGFWRDLKILALTIPSLLRKQGAR